MLISDQVPACTATVSPSTVWSMADWMLPPALTLMTVADAGRRQMSMATNVAKIQVMRFFMEVSPC